RGGQINLSAEQRESDIGIRVQDTGVGIGPELLPHIFEPFVQADQTLARTQGGLGIGLTLVRRLTELHGGKVEAHSDGRGCGSEFRLTIPKATERNGAESARTSDAATGPRRR